ncbi:MAG: hypothetical protein AB7N65_03295 [Vicinamibacterales bacterium]
MSDAKARSSRGPLSPWRWLIDLREHLGAHVELLDADGRPLLPPRRGAVADRLTASLTALPHASFTDAQRRLSREGGVIPARVDGLRVAATTVRARSGPGLTLLLAERADCGREVERREELRRLAGWLARAVDVAASEPRRDWREVPVLYRVLQRGVAAGSIVATIRGYIEALAIWEDAETRAYQGNDGGEFLLEIALAGAHAHDAPRRLAWSSLRVLGESALLQPAAAEALGFFGRPDLLLSRVRVVGQPPWLLAYVGRLEPDRRNRLALFEAMLVAALRTAGQVEASRLEWSLLQQLVDEARPPLEAGASALTEVERAGLCNAFLRVCRGKELLFSLGVDVPSSSDPRGWPTTAVRRVPVRVPAPCDAMLTLWRPPSRPFTLRETSLSRIAATVFGAWATALLARPVARQPGRTRPAVDRRRGPRPRTVSLLVILPERTDTAREIREGWIRELRGQLRPADIIGGLDSGDISILLADSGETDARAVAVRLGQLFGDRSGLALLDGSPIGTATVTRPGPAPGAL